MKFRSFIIAMIGYVAIMFAASCEAEGYVSERPGDVTYERPAAPGDGYVWISGDWVWEGGNYRWHQGRWDRRQEGRAWIDGSWEHRHHGWRWHHGYWQ